MKRLILLALIPALVGCANLTKQQNQLLGAVVGVAAANELAEGHKDQRWAIGIGTLAGAMIVNAIREARSGDWWPFWD